jgi:hypothetical protein
LFLAYLAIIIRIRWKQFAEKAVAEQKLERGAISCNQDGNTCLQTVLYIWTVVVRNLFTSVVNKIESPGSAPQGMVVVPVASSAGRC